MEEKYPFPEIFVIPDLLNEKFVVVSSEIVNENKLWLVANLFMGNKLIISDLVPPEYIYNIRWRGPIEDRQFWGKLQDFTTPKNFGKFS